MSPEDAWRDNRAAVEIQCNEARADERRRICAYLNNPHGLNATVRTSTPTGDAR